MNKLMELLLNNWTVKGWRLDNVGMRIVVIERLEMNSYEWRNLNAYVIF